MVAVIALVSLLQVAYLAIAAVVLRRSPKRLGLRQEAQS
jgi:hypothetical protein